MKCPRGCVLRKKVKDKLHYACGKCEEPVWVLDRRTVYSHLSRCHGIGDIPKEVQASSSSQQHQPSNHPGDFGEDFENNHDSENDRDSENDHDSENENADEKEPKKNLNDLVDPEKSFEYYPEEATDEESDEESDEKSDEEKEIQTATLHSLQKGKFKTRI